MCRLNLFRRSMTCFGWTCVWICELGLNCLSMLFLNLGTKTCIRACFACVHHVFLWAVFRLSCCFESRSKSIISLQQIPPAGLEPGRSGGPSIRTSETIADLAMSPKLVNFSSTIQTWPTTNQGSAISFEYFWMYLNLVRSQSSAFNKFRHRDSNPSLG